MRRKTVSVKANICLTYEYFLLRVVWNKEMLYHHCFSTLL